MLKEAHPLVRRVLRFAMLPYCYFRLVNWQDCTRSRLGVALDFLYIFFVLKDYPDHYGACRLWEVPRAQWARYYGSNYNPYQRVALRARVHPVELERAFQNKEVCDGLSRRMRLPVPVQVGTLDPDDDVGTLLPAMLARVAERRLIIKPVNGHAGLGVALAQEVNGVAQVRIGSRVMRASDYRPPQRCIVQEVLRQADDVAVIAPASMNTLRLLTMLVPGGRIIVVGASMRFGVGDAFIDNWSAGGVAVGVDHTRGELMAHGYDKKGNRYTEHPVSKVVFAGFRIRGWAEAVALGNRVQESFPFFRLLGMDIGFTPSGPVLIEINSDADLVFQEQTSGPLFASRETWEAFREYGLLISAPQKALYE